MTDTLQSGVTQAAEATDLPVGTALVRYVAASAAPPPAEAWRRRVFRALMYGTADRNTKARARIGLAVIAFAAIYGIIAGRLVLYAMTPDSRGAGRVGGGDAVATARPDIVDRNGEVLATDVKAASL